MGLWILVLPFLFGAGEDPRPTPEIELLGRLHQRMGAELERLPAHACLATIQRSIRSKKKLLMQDRIRLEAAFTGMDETFSWPGSATFGPAAALQVSAGGAGAIGGWSAWSRRIFRSSSLALSHNGSCTADGRQGVQYDFRVAWSASAYSLAMGGKEVVVPYSGSVCVDPGSLDVMRLEVHVDVAKLPLSAVTETIQYARVNLGGGQFLLPRSHEVVMTDQEGNEGRNLTTLTDCREYKAAPPEKAEQQMLPPGLDLEMKLDSRIDFEQAYVGDPITARLSRAFKAVGASFPKRTVVSGRIRRLEERYQPEKHYLVGLEFTSLSAGGPPCFFRAQLVGPGLRFNRRPDSVDQRTLYNPPPPMIDITGLEIDELDPIPGVGVFRIRKPRLNLLPGLRMEWKTGLD